jgi:hemerythrin-like domain-containing protein
MDMISDNAAAAAEAEAADLALSARAGWPEPLRFLLTRYPRQVWPGHANLGLIAQFWLERHDMFRALGGALGEATVELKEGRVAPDRFQGWFAPRLSFFLQSLHGHHWIEDAHYFPALAAAEARLAPGFAVLERDHGTLDAAIRATAAAGNALLGALAGPPGDADGPAAAYAAESEALLAALMRHLGDEEDLIVPLILDRGEGRLGLL